MQGLPSIPSRPMPAPLAVAQLLNVRAAIAIRKDRLMHTVTRCTICGPEPAEPYRDCPDDPAHRAAVAALIATDHGETSAPVTYPRTCRCGQLAMGHFDTCDACRAAERAPQGTQQSLFTPTAAPIPGQLTL